MRHALPTASLLLHPPTYYLNRGPAQLDLPSEAQLEVMVDARTSLAANAQDSQAVPLALGRVYVLALATEALDAKVSATMPILVSVRWQVEMPLSRVGFRALENDLLL